MCAAVRPLACVRVGVYLQLLHAVEGLLTKLTGEVFPPFPLWPPLPHSIVLCRVGAVIVGGDRGHGDLARASHAVDTRDVSDHWQSDRGWLFNTTERPGTEEVREDDGRVPQEERKKQIGDWTNILHFCLIKQWFLILLRCKTLNSTERFVFEQI